MPRHVDAGQGLIVVIPDLHRLHHSRGPEGADANFGSINSLWDRVFGTFKSPVGAVDIPYGVEG